MLKKKKIVSLLLLATCFLVLLIVLSSKVLTIKSSSIDNGTDEQAMETHEGLEMERVRADYLDGLQSVAIDFEAAYNNLEVLFASTSASVNSDERSVQISKIKDLQQNVTALLVPPEYRKQHLKLVLDFQKINPQLENSELLDNLKLILLDLKEN